MRELNSNCEVDWTAVCAHLYVLKDAVTPEQIEKKQNSTMVLQSHLKAFNTEIKSMRPLMKFGFHEHSLIVASPWFNHFQETLPFLVGQVNPDERELEFIRMEELVLWDFVLAPREQLMVTVQQNYEGPLVAGLDLEEKEELCYDVDDLKEISGKIEKQQHISNLY